MTFCGLLAACAGIPPAPSATVATHDPALRAQRAEALLQALMTLGVDYRNGGSSPATGFDCSGLVAHVFREAWGLRLPRTAHEQSATGIPVSLSELQAGDLVFYDTLGRPYSHVGIYLGDGKFVHAPKSGAQVRVENLRNGYWTKRFNGARRISPSL
jgi:cell wall-associated NlpC family hydrolase